MSVNFSTISPLSPATISKAPTYSNANAQAAPQAAASSPVAGDNNEPKKKSYKLAGTLITAAVLVAAAALLRGKVDMFKNFNKTEALAENAKFKDKMAYYGKKAVATVGDFINETVIGGIKKLFKGKAKDDAGNTATGTAASATETGAATTATEAGAATTATEAGATKA